MCGSLDGTSGSSPSNPPNAFTAWFLARLGERDEPPTAGEAAVAGPWRIEPVAWRGGGGFGLFRAGQTLARGFQPVAVFPSRWLALVTAAVLPGTGRDPMLRLAKEADAAGWYPLTLDTGEVAGGFDVFDERLMDAVNIGIHLLQAPLSLADLLDAAGAESLLCCGSILDERHPAPTAVTPG